jgi:hypothetical protein
VRDFLSGSSTLKETLDLRRGNLAGYNLWGQCVHGSRVLDTRILGSCAIGDALHYVPGASQILEMSFGRMKANLVASTIACVIE